MWLHIEFKDASNPYIMYGTKTDILREYKWHKCKYGDSILPEFGANGLLCRACSGGGFAVGKYFDGAHHTKYYQRIGDALNFLDKFKGVM